MLVVVLFCIRPHDDHAVPYQEDDRDQGFFGFRAFPFNHDSMFQQLDEAFSHMMKHFGSFDGQLPDQEQGAFFSCAYVFGLD